jgi:hypothetical protein
MAGALAIRRSFAEMPIARATAGRQSARPRFGVFMISARRRERRA